MKRRAIFQIMQRPYRNGKRLSAVTIIGVAHRPKSKDNVTRWAYVTLYGHVRYYSEQGQWHMGTKGMHL